MGRRDVTQARRMRHRAVLRLRRRAPDQRRRREVQSHAQGTDHPWPHLPQHRGAAERRPRVRRTVQCPVARREERLPEPRSGPSGVGRRDVTQARRMRQTCVQGTGCDTLFASGNLRYPGNRLANRYYPGFPAPMHQLV